METPSEVNQVQLNESQEVQKAEGTFTWFLVEVKEFYIAAENINERDHLTKKDWDNLLDMVSSSHLSRVKNMRESEEKQKTAKKSSWFFAEVNELLDLCVEDIEDTDDLIENYRAISLEDLLSRSWSKNICPACRKSMNTSQEKKALGKISWFLIKVEVLDLVAENVKNPDYLVDLDWEGLRIPEQLIWNHFAHEQKLGKFLEEKDEEGKISYFIWVTGKKDAAAENVDGPDGLTASEQPEESAEETPMFDHLIRNEEMIHEEPKLRREGAIPNTETDQNERGNTLMTVLCQRFHFDHLLMLFFFVYVVFSIAYNHQLKEDLHQ